MNLYVFLGYAAAVIQTILAVVVIAKNPKRKENRLFCVLLLLFVAWNIGEIIIFYKGVNPNTIKIMLTPAILLTYVFCIFTAVFPEPQPDAHIIKTNKNTFLFSLPALYLLILLFTDNLFASYEKIADGFSIVFGKNEFVIKGIVIGYLLLSLLTLSKSNKKTQTHTQSLRLKYTFAAMLLPVAAGSITIALSKFFLGGQTIYGLGLFPVLGIIMSLILTYTMLRYNLMEIDIIFSIGLVYTLTTAALAGCMELIQELMQNILNSSDGWAKVVTILVIAAIFSPIKDALTALVDKFFGKKSFDSAQVMQKTLEKLRNQSDIDKMLNSFVNEIVYITEASSIEFIKPNQYAQKELSNFPEKQYDIDAIIFNYNNLDDKANEEKAISLKENDVKLYYPIAGANNYYGNLLIGVKKTKVPYTEAETNLISGLANELPHIIENIKMINQILEQEKSAQEIKIADNLLKTIAHVPGVDFVQNYSIVSYVTLAHGIKGDMIDLNNNEKNRYIAIFDAFHSGIKAVLTLNIAYSVFRTTEDNDDKFLKSHNLLKTFSEQELCFAATLISFDNSLLHIRNFGNPAPLFIANNSVQPLKELTNSPIGIEKEFTQKTATVTLKDNNLLFCSTNGLYKAFEQFKGISLESFLDKQNFVNAQECRDAISQAITAHISEGFSDDITFIVVGLK
ncbi:MAG: SpoIIE family protein phosphatase [Candidatus Riflebacteria bacterium]|nr:SpoIIE family protein phosphatase [Candidatus Riflebacteria bacterium]